MQQSFQVVSLSHISAPVRIREKLHLTNQESHELLFSLRDLLGVEEAMICSTCNRTEVYFIGKTAYVETIIRLLCQKKELNEADYISFFRIIENENEATRYLFEVAMGLHSSVLGDLQISNQVKQAYAISNEANLAGPYLHRLMHTIFHTNKRVYQETAFRDGAASVSYAASELATELVGAHQQSKILVLGLGEMGEDVAKNLNKEKHDAIYLCNRTYLKAEVLAESLEVEVFPIEELEANIQQFDVIIAAIQVEKPLIKKEWFDAERLKHQVIIDLSIPRAVEEQCQDLPQLLIYTIDDINNRTEKVLGRRKAAISAVEKIIDEEFQGFTNWKSELSISPAIHKIKAALEQIRQEELARFSKESSPRETQLLEAMSKNMVQKILKLPVLQLKKACLRGESSDVVDIITEIFDLEASRRNNQ